jgi:hypothetical protein
LSRANRLMLGIVAALMIFAFDRVFWAYLG